MRDMAVEPVAAVLKVGHLKPTYAWITPLNPRWGRLPVRISPDRPPGTRWPSIKTDMAAGQDFLMPAYRHHSPDHLARPIWNGMIRR